MDKQRMVGSFPVTDEWREAVRRELEQRKWSQAELARRLGCSQPMVHKLLAAGGSGSALVPAVHEVLGWPPPRRTDAPDEPQRQRGGQEFAVDDTWRATVQRGLRDRGWRQADLARAVQVSSSIISQLLTGLISQSSLVPEIHRALGWAEPRIFVPSGSEGELLKVWDLLDEVNRARLLERASALLEVQPKAPRPAEAPPPRATRSAPQCTLDARCDAGDVRRS